MATRDFVASGQVLPQVFDQASKRLRVVPDQRESVEVLEDILVELRRIRVGMSALLDADLTEIGE